ncbi:uncharacterized protein [Drosophila kikkawai]|uniref:BED-type domain-containing protein n=1 Tax=Drosophila kikkawai TaxID=30033 RepID=A0A6P4INL0_DROKI|nr:uncharacterized protein LOC108076185 [Drosophila kikkawai]
MGRVAGRVQLFFTYDKTKDQSKCNICGIKLAGHHSTNLKRHLSKKHQETYESLSEDIGEPKKACKRRKIVIETTEDEVISAVVNIASDGGNPLSLFDNEGFRMLFNPIFDALEMPQITSQNIMDHVSGKELDIKQGIRASVERKLVSLKLDVATGLERSVLVINLQFISSTLTGNDIVVKTLGVIQLSEDLTELCLKNKIVETMESYGIQMDQIFSITTDNGKNMATAIELLNENAAAESVNDEDNGEYFMELLNSMTFPNVPLLRCAAHTLHLCVHDVNRQSEFSQKFSSCRQMCKVLRIGKYRRTLMQEDKPIPTLDVPGRWNSSYTMLVQLFELKEFITSQIEVDFSIDWAWVEVYIEAFKETHEATLLLEKEHFSYSDFFILWMELKLKAEKTQNYLMKELLCQLKVREKQLWENKAFLAAIYMDPRVNLILTAEQKATAKILLKQIAFRIFSSNGTIKPPEIKIESTEADVKEKSLLESFLDDIQTLPQAEFEADVSEKLAKIYMEIENFSTAYGRLPLNSDIKKFYHDLKFRSPQIGALVQVVLAAPASQVTVVRSFSALKVIINYPKTLTPENMNSLLIVRLNS